MREKRTVAACSMRGLPLLIAAMKPEALVTLRTRLGFSQAKMAVALGIGRRTLGIYENGRSEIPKSVALACAALAFGLPPME